MKSRDIKFANEFCFNVKCESPVIELKEHNTYEYQIAAESLMISRNFCLITAVRFFRACQKSEFEVKFENIISYQQSHWNLLKKAENP